MSSTLTDTLVSAIEDGTDLVAWFRPNEVALSAPRVEAAVLRGLGGPVPAECAAGTPLLRYADGVTPAIPLLSAVVADLPVNPTGEACDVCQSGVGSDYLYTLRIPSGASLVELWLCNACHYEANVDNEHSLVWG